MAIGIRANRVAVLAMAIGVAGLAGGDPSSGAVIMPPPVDPVKWGPICGMRGTDDSAPTQPESESAPLDDSRAVSEHQRR